MRAAVDAKNERKIRASVAGYYVVERVVESGFVDNGQPAVILPLADWKKGAGPDV